MVETGALASTSLPKVHGRCFDSLGKLQVAARHVEAAGVAEHRRQRVAARDLERRRAERDDQLEFEMIIGRAGRVGDGRPRFPERRRALGEIERLFAIDNLSRFAGVVFVVAADAENSRDRIATIVARDRQ